MQAGDELLCVDDALGVYLVNICVEHLFESGSESLRWELEFFIFGQDLFHLSNGDTSLAVCIFLAQDIIERQFIQIHLRNVDLV